MSGNNRRIPSSVLVALAVAAAARIVAWVFVDTALLRATDGPHAVLMEYGIIARNILAGHGFAYTWTTFSGSSVILQSAYMPPGQVWIDTACLWLFGPGLGGVFAVFVINVALGVVAVYLISRIADVLFASRRITNVTLWGAALFPPFIYATATFGVSSAVMAINAFILLECIKSIRSSHNRILEWGSVVRIGIGFGALLLFRGEAPLFLAVTAGLFLWVWRKALRQAVVRVGAVVLIALAIVAPWTLRNYLAFDRFILTSTNGGFNFYRGNNPGSIGSAWTPEGSAVWGTDEQWQRAERSMTSGGAFERSLSQIFYSDAMEWIGSHPGDAAMLALRKGVIFWTVDRMSPMGGTLAYMSISIVTLVLLLIGLYRLRASPGDLHGISLIFVWTVTSTMVAMIFFPMPRLQVIMIAGYFPIVAVGADAIAGVVRRKPQLL